MNKLRKLDFYDWIFIFVLLAFVFFGFYRLGSMIFNSDAHFWYQRSLNFVQAIKDLNLEKTFQNPKPGVTVMWLSGFSMEVFFTLYNAIFKFRPLLYTYDTFPYIHFAARAPLVVLSAGLLVWMYLLLNKLTTKPVSLLTVSFLAFQHFFVATTRLFHADSTVAVFMTLSALLLLRFVLADQSRKDLVISAVFAGLAINTKLSGIFLIPYAFLVLFGSGYLSIKNLSKAPSQALKWLIVALLTVFVTFPALWVSPISTVKTLFNEGLEVVDEGRGDGINPPDYYLGVLPDHMTELLLIFLVAGLLAQTAEFKKMDRKQKYFYTMIFFFAFFYLLQMSLAIQKMPRYVLPIFPFLSIIAAYGVMSISKGLKFINEKILIGGIIFLNLVWLAFYFPHYSLYFNAKGKDTFDCTMCREVSEYINVREPDPEFSVVVNTQNPHRFRPFIKGLVLDNHEFRGQQIDYMIMGGIDDIDVYGFCTPLRDFAFKGYNYWHVYSCKGEGAM